jgi:hypothetical protein
VKLRTRSSARGSLDWAATLRATPRHCSTTAWSPRSAPQLGTRQVASGQRVVHPLQVHCDLRVAREVVVGRRLVMAGGHERQTEQRPDHRDEHVTPTTRRAAFHGQGDIAIRIPSGMSFKTYGYDPGHRPATRAMVKS